MEIPHKERIASVCVCVFCKAELARTSNNNFLDRFFGDV